MGFGSGGGFKPGAGDIKGNLTVTGNVGIGTPSPDGTLHVMKASAGSVTVTGDQANGIIIEDDDSTAITLLDPSGGVIYFGDADDTDIGRIGYRHGGDYANSMYFWTNNAQQMTINSAGNVGIGTSTFDGTAAGVLTIKNGTSPAALTADQIYIGSKDSAGTGTDELATLELFTEEAIDATALDAAGTLSHRIPIWLNGTCYWLYLDPV